MKNIDPKLTRAICNVIGERMRASPNQSDLPASMRIQLDRLRELDDDSPATAPSVDIWLPTL